MRAEPIGSIGAPAVALQAGPGSDPSLVADALRATFVPASPAFAALCAIDPVVRALDLRYPGLRPVLHPDLLNALIRSISAQQINLRWAAETRRRLALARGVPFQLGGELVYRFDAASLAATPVADIRALQFTTAKAVSIVAVADELASGRLDAAALNALDDEAIIERLTRIRGIGRWSAEWILARTFGRPRVVAGDLGVRKAVARAYLGRAIASDAEVRAATAHWGEGATVAQVLLLRTLVDEGQ